MPNTYHMTMDQSKQTKGTVVFSERVDNPDERPHTFYILKDTFADLGSPESIAVLISTAVKPKVQNQKK